MSIDKTLEPLRPYVIGIRYVEGLPVVDVIFKETWIVPEATGIKRIQGPDEPNYSMLFTEESSMNIDDLLNYVADIIKVNLENEAKDELLKNKIVSLKALFKTTSLEVLKTLRFDITSNINTINPETVNNSFDVTPKTDLPVVMDKVTELSQEDIEYMEGSRRAEEFSKSKLYNKRQEEVKNLTAPALQDFPTPADKVCSCGEGEACALCIDYY